jgi:peptidoglycan/LPS O-acetylase OafA/YrhL
MWCDAQNEVARTLNAPAPEARLPTGASRGHISALDGLRGIAVLAVIAFHLQFVFPETPYLLHVAKRAAWFGWSGVDLFFVLSGFLITGILLESKGSSNYFRSFYARRVLRIFPVYYGVLTVMVVTAPFLMRHSINPPPHPWTYYLYLTNWFDPSTPAYQKQLVGHFWTLSVEEQFYIAWPICVLMLPKKSLGILCGTGILGAFVLRCYLVSHGANVELIYKNLFTRMDTLLVGALIAIYPLGRMKPALPALASACLGSCFLVLAWKHQLVQSHTSTFMQTVGYSLLAFGFGAVVLLATANDSVLLRYGPLVRTGKYSYGIYIYHIPVLVMTAKVLSKVWPSYSPLMFSAIGVTLTIVVAQLSFERFERQLLKLKDRFVPVKSEPASAA